MKLDFNDTSILIGMIALVAAATIKDLTAGIALGGVFAILIGFLRQRAQDKHAQGGDHNGPTS